MQTRKRHTLTKQSRILKPVSLFLILMLLALACNLPFGRQATETPAIASPQALVSPTPTIPDSGLEVIDDGRPLPPRLLSVHPAGGEGLAVDGTIQLTFDQPMEAESTAKAWEMTDAHGKPVPGDIQWLSPRVMSFSPATPLEPESMYFANLSTSAENVEGIALSEPVSLEFVTLGPLKISQVFPADGSAEIENNAAITVIFNRPVVPLVIAEEQPPLPQPLEITPAVSGSGEWVNTSVYAFRPEKPLSSGTTYQVTVGAGLKDASQETSLEEDYSWQFQTAPAAIQALELSSGQRNPKNNLTNVLLDEYFTILFQQPMDTSSVEANLSLTSLTGDSVPLLTDWDEEWTRVVVTPTQQLALGTGYILRLRQEAQATDGGTLKEGLDWQFSTIPSPAVLFTDPANGTEQSRFSRFFKIKFASPMNLESVKENIIVSPAPEEEIEWWYNDWDWSISGFFLEPSTQYEIQILPGMEDIYGNVMASGMTIRFTTAAFYPTAYLQMPYSPAVFRQSGEQDFYIQYRNVQYVNLNLYQLNLKQFTDLLLGEVSQREYVPPAESLVWQTQERNTAGLNQLVLKSFSFKDENLPAGYYFLTLDHPEASEDRRFADTRMVVIANANLTLKTSALEGLVWLTDLESGMPLVNVPVTLYDDDLQPIGSGETNTSGLLSLSLPQPTDDYTTRFALVQSDEIFAFTSSQWGSGVDLWEYGIWGSYYAPARDLVGYLYTERPIYRPGQPVYFKGILRTDDDLDYALPTFSTVHITVSSYKDKVYQADLKLSEYGTFSDQFTLDQEAALGNYIIQVSIPGQDRVIASLSFNVAEYRKPEFQVKVTAQPENLYTGDSFDVVVQAEYYSGGGVSEAEVNWRLVAEPFRYTPPDEFSSYNFADYEADSGFYEAGPPAESEIIAQGSGKTDAQGEFHLTLPAEIAESTQSMRLTFEADVVDISKNLVSSRATVIAHRSGVYPGVRAESYVGREGVEASFLLVALDWEGNPIPGQTLDVEIVERRWHSVQEQDANGMIHWTSSVEEIPVTSFENVTTDEKGEALVNFTPPNGGVYRAKVSAQDENGRPARSSAFMWVTGKSYVPWRQTDDHSFDLITDKTSYTPGDVAEVLIASPFQGDAYALITVERGRVRFHEVIQLTSNSTVYSLPISADMAPNAYISVLIIKGVDENNPRPNFKLGVQEIQVDTSKKEINIQLSAEPEEAGPGDRVTFRLKTLDSQGNPLPAEVSLSLSDLATLSLMEPNAPPLLDYFYAQRDLGVWTSVPLVLSIEAYNASIVEALEPEGGGLGSGGGKGGGILGVVEVRQDFPDTAYWEAHLVTDANGEAVIEVTLPDNLTTWRLDARAVTKDTRVGQSTLDIISSKPLLVRPQTPRFLVAQDQVRLGSVVQNNTTNALQVEVSLQARGLTLLEDNQQSVEIPAQSQVLVTWDATVDADSQRVDLVFSAEGGGLRDASRPPMGTLDNHGIPVYRFEAYETVRTSGMLTAEGTLIEAISLPQGIEVEEGELSISLSPSLSAGLIDGLTYLKHFPFECVEQTVSRFLPNVLTNQALQATGISDPGLSAGLEEQVNTALQRLYNWQNADGGWGWWKGNQSDINTTAYAVLGLIEASEAGYSVNESNLMRALTYLRDHLESLPSLPEPSKANRQAFVLYVLARSGKADVSRTVQIYDLRAHLSLYARALLMQTLHIIDQSDPRIDTLRTDLTSAAIHSATGSHWEEGERDVWNWNTDTRTTAIILSALAQIAPDDPLNANAVRWLMSHRQEDHWSGSQETAWTIMALTRWMVASGELLADYNYAVALNGERLGGGTANAETLQQNLNLRVDVSELLQDELNRLAIARDEGAGNLYYTAHLKLSLPVEHVQALDRGIILSRSYYHLEDLETPITQASQGELILARMTLIAPSTLHYVIVEDPLPAGLEAVDQSLSTSPQTIEVPQQYTWEDIFWRGWGWWHFDHIQKYDEKVILSANLLPPGTYVYTYLVRAATVGIFKTIPPTAYEFYFPEVYGRGSGIIFTVTP